MYTRNISQADGYSKMVKPNVQHHLSSASNKHSSSHIKDAKKAEILQRQKSGDGRHIQRTSSHTTKSSHDHNKQHKVQGALRSCGSWSEHRSSSGKIYFYNTLSEVSQWEKPKEWNDGIAVDLKSKEKLKSSVQRNSAKTTSSRHSSSSKPNENSSADTDKDYRHHKDYCDRDYRNRPSTSDHDYKDIDYRNAASSKTSNTKNNVKRAISTDRDYRAHNSSVTNTLPNHESNSSIKKEESYLPSTGKFYDYSKWNASTSNTDTKTINGVTSSTESFHKNTEGDHDSKNKLSASSAEFMRKLSSVLTQAATTSSTNSSKSEENIKDVFQLLLDVASKGQVDDTAIDASKPNEVKEDDRETPALKRLKTQDETEKKPSTQMNAKKEVDQFKGLEEFRSVFDSSLIFHVQNWPAEHNEKQCNRLSEDYHRFVADQMSELNVRLTTARSKVRTSEILSTLHEQRVLYIRQQIKDLEKSSTAAAPFT